MFSNIKISTQIMFGAILTPLVLIFAYFMINQKLTEINQEHSLVNDVEYPRTQYINNMIHGVNITRIEMKNLVYVDNTAQNAETIANARKLLAEMKEFNNENYSKLIKLTEEEKGKEYLEKIKTSRLAFLEKKEEILRLIDNGNKGKAAELMLGDFHQKITAYFDVLNEFLKYEQQRFETISNNSKELANKTVNQLIILVVVLSIITLLLSIVIYRSIDKTINNTNNLIANLIANINQGKLDVRGNADDLSIDFKDIMHNTNKLIDTFVAPLNNTSLYIDRIAKGDIPSKIEEEYKGDFNEIKNNINTLIDTLNTLTHQMDNMNTQHELGDIDVIIDTNLFIGVYKKVSSGINKMVNDHIHVKKEAIRIFSEYGNGNFSANIEKLPGKKEFVNVAINQVQSNLIKINKEINQLALSAKEGNLKYRADEEQFKGDWAKLIKTINELIDNLLYPINETVEVLQEMSEGNLSVEMKGNYNGEHAILKNAINKTVALMPFKEAVMVLQNVSDGDLTTLMTGDYKGDSLLLKNALNNTIESISEILQQVANTVEEVTNGANQVSDASSSLSQGATEQAASLEEITSSMSEIGSKTNQNASNAKLASNLTFDAKETAMLGSREMDELQKSMHEISQSSKDISKIIKVIDEIAFQTNLLALNAAVEAARAGRHGKGFAVVAEEVRNLAARSAKAAKETAEMIETSIRTVEKGANIAQKTADVLENIKDGAVKAADLVGEIAVSSNEQAMAISQISEGLHQIDKVTQTNTASAEESASASEELSGQASNLKRMIMKFKLNGNTVNFSNNYLTTSQSKNYRLESKKKHLQAAPNNDDFINLTNDDFGRY